jgi:SAM-dependent methyltransferase
VRDDLFRLPLACPQCDLLLEGVGTSTRECTQCERAWQLTDGKWWFGGSATIQTGDQTDGMKSRLKLHPALYTALVDVISPVYPHWIKERRRLKRTLRSDMVAIDVGSGNTRQFEGIVTVDLMPYPNVDVVSDADRLPFASQSVDVVVSIAVLEHVPDPRRAIAELIRVMKPGGRAFIFVPFMQGFHAAPHDYQRFTRPGLELALSELTIERTESFGPTSGLVWVLGEWLSIPLSFGVRRVQPMLALLLQTLLSPLKFLDILLRRMPGSENISTGFLVIATKEPSA